jgi:uncharacterized membrane protein
MAVKNHVENPFEYLIERAAWAASDIRRAAKSPARVRQAQAVEIRRIAPQDLGAALREGLADLGAARADVVFLAVIYPIAGLVLASLAFRHNLLPLIFPLVSGFAILGPLAAVGLYEISRRREAGQPVSAADGVRVLHSPALGSILGVGAILLVLFAAWPAAAWGVYALTLGPEPPASLGQFVEAVVLTPAGWAMTLIGCAVGAVFAAAAFSISVISIPLLLDRDVSLPAALGASLRAVRDNPGTMAIWAAVIAGALVLGSLPALAGLILVMPLFGHASWHLYRRVVA